MSFTPSAIDNLYPLEDPNDTIILHTAFVDDDDIKDLFGSRDGMGWDRANPSLTLFDWWMGGMGWNQERNITLKSRDSSTVIPNPFLPSPSTEEDGMIYVGDLGYMSTPCPSPPLGLDNLYPLEDPNDTIILHTAFVDDDDIKDLINEDIYNFRYMTRPPRDA
uniref:Uncharacterized protein n=1 Tax=Oryza brachyantha TaxID=4533 RepID=J3L8F5_ORYBR